jgi:hypothetical protein
MIDFPQGIPEDTRIQVCKMLEERDQEIKKLYKDIIVLENKIERFNGGLTWKESENLKTQMAINNGVKEQIYNGLRSFNLRAVEYKDPKCPYAFPVKIEKIPILERLSAWLKSLIKFELVRKSSN